MSNLSNRKFLLVGIEGMIGDFSSTYDLDSLLKDDGTEVTYAIQEEIDRILDLRIGESLFINIDRDNKENKGVIKRIS